VSLPTSQQRVLDEIEVDLRGCEPRLTSMFSIFTRLTRDDGAPRTEALRDAARFQWFSPGARLRTIVIVPLALALVGLFIFVAVVGSSARGCSPAATSRSSPASHSMSCQSAPETPGG
jgi:hypothetical protein